MRGWTLWALLPAFAAGQGPYDAPPPARPAVKITLGATANSAWALTADVHNGKVTAVREADPPLRLEIDCDDHRRDGHYEGITIVRGNRRLEGRFHGSVVSMLSPDHDAGPVHACLVEALDEGLRVRFENGSFDRLQPAAGGEPVYFEAFFALNKERRWRVFLDGLYYIFPTRDGAVVRMTPQAERRITRESPKSIEYFERVTEFTVEDPHYGTFTWKGLVERLQIQVHAAPQTDLFELDFDHSFKDRGQRRVPAVLELLF